MIPEWVRIEGIPPNNSVVLIKVSSIIALEVITTDTEMGKEIQKITVNTSANENDGWTFYKDRYKLSNLLRLYSYFGSVMPMESGSIAPVTRPATAE